MKQWKRLAALLLAASFGAQAEIISLTNPGFETPASGKITGFDASPDVPGWTDLGVNSDSGVESGGNTGANTGAYGAFFKGGDPGVAQMTTYTIQEGDVFTVGLYAKNIWAATELTVTLIDDAAHVLGSSVADVSSASGYAYFEVDIAATAASVGNQLGLQLQDAVSGGNWVAVDDVTLNVSTNSVVEPPPPPPPPPAAVSVRPTTEPVATVDLSGTWDFTPDGQATTNIVVPGGGWRKQGFEGLGEADYETTITVPDSGQPQATWLEFGAINYEADLYIDEVYVTNSVQAYTPAAFDISGFVTPGSSHDVRVHVKGMWARMNDGMSIDPNGAGSWASDFLPQGIFRSAELKVFPQVYIADVFVKPSVADSQLFYDVTLRNTSAGATNITLSGSLSSWNGEAWSYPSLPQQSLTLAAGAETNLTVGPVSWTLGTDSYWWPNVPYQEGYRAQLHDLTLSLAPAAGGEVIHTNATRFGFRECTQGPDGLGNTCYFLNGIRVNFRGDSLQGANYDRIDNNGQGNAFDTYPGFLPGTNGWPKAVDNYQRLNYNVVRIHQIPATPYMLDVCDEMGLMLINETGIRGSGGQQDFITGHDNMVNHVTELFTRDRNHASIVRLSQANEPDHSWSDSVDFELDLYAAAMAADGTRPISIDGAWNQYDSITYSNFSVFTHYGLTHNEFGQYTDEVFARTDRPYGQGEFLWPSDNTPQGFTWFATAAQAMREKGASDIRPYTLLSAWSSVIPGTKTTDMRLENPPWDPSLLYPLYGEDNLPDPWSNAQIQRVQAGYNPVLVADADYWEEVKLSGSGGGWPETVPFLLPSESVTRTLNIYNDTFSGTDVDVFWELCVGSSTGTVADSGSLQVSVPFGTMVTEDIAFTTPYVTNGASLFLVLRSEKDGVELFREEAQQFRVFNSTELSGTAFGTTPAWSAESGYEKATDGDPGTFFDYLNENGGYTGIDLGAGNESAISYLVFSPRSGYEDRMVGGQFQGSNTGIDSGYTTLFTVEEQPSGTVTVEINSGSSYRYLRYLAPDGTYGNIAEMTFYSGVLSADAAWRLLNFGSIDSSGDAADDADPDGDGVINLVERATGGNPNVADAERFSGFDPAAPLLSIDYCRADGASDLVFEVQECTNLVSGAWSPAAGTNAVLSDDGLIQSNRFTVSVGGEAGKFLRVQLVIPES